MKRLTRYAVGAALLSIGLANLLIGLIAHRPLNLAVAIIPTGIGILHFVTAIKESRREHRSASGNRDRSGSLTLTNLGSFTSYGASSHSFATGGPIGAPVPLKESTSEIPILAYKVANLAWLPNRGARFAPLNQGGTYTADEESECRAGMMSGFIVSTSVFGVPSPPVVPSSAGKSHSPDPSCTCGFYACTDLSMLDGGMAVLEVELSGRVIVCERGYRAGHQRVIRAHLRGCHYCGFTPSVVSFEDNYTLQLRCDQHAIPNAPSLSIADLGSALGVPVDVESSVKTREAAS